jgi:hypothetical protein
LSRHPIHWHPHDTDKINSCHSDITTNTFLTSFFQLWRQTSIIYSRTPDVIHPAMTSDTH